MEMDLTNEVYIERELRLRFPELDSEQFVRSKEMATAFSYKNNGRLPSLEGIVRLVRSMPERPTPNTSALNKGKI